MTDNAKRKEIFSFHDEQYEFDKSVTDVIRRMTDKQRDAVMPEENIISYSHGSSWIAFQQDDDSEQKSFEEHGHEEIVQYADILNHDLSILPKFIQNIVKGMHDEFMKMMYQTVNDATDRTGNVIDAKKHNSPAEAFMEMLRKIEFGVDKNGEVSRPEIHMHPSTVESWMENLESQDEQFKAEIEDLTAEKEAAALEREALRKGRFKKQENIYE